MALSLLAHAAALLILLLPNQTVMTAPAEPAGVALLFEPAPAPAPPVADAAPAELPDAAPSQTEASLPAEPPPPTPVPQDVAIAAPPMPLPLPPVPAAPMPHRPVARPAARPAPMRPAETTATQPAPSGMAQPAASEPIVPPRPVAGMETNRPPVYPDIARRRGEQGRVMLRVSVSTDGTPLEVDVLATSGHPSLDSAALSTVRQWRFVPAMRTGMPVPATAEVPIRFRLDN